MKREILGESGGNCNWTAFWVGTSHEDWIVQEIASPLTLADVLRCSIKVEVSQMCGSDLFFYCCRYG